MVVRSHCHAHLLLGAENIQGFLQDPAAGEVFFFPSCASFWIYSGTISGRWMMVT